jgi:hypothetical protein
MMQQQQSTPTQNNQNNSSEAGYQNVGFDSDFVNRRISVSPSNFDEMMAGWLIFTLLTCRFVLGVEPFLSFSHSSLKSDSYLCSFQFLM